MHAFSVAGLYDDSAAAFRALARFGMHGESGHTFLQYLYLEITKGIFDTHPTQKGDANYSVPEMQAGFSAPAYDQSIPTQTS
ncbi:hypothetical protein [Akkermansia sp.]|uniref:hypothetical protein n=1 Tax=Akkermansia sp. TaxID=1872421 RepID=UPI003991E762